MRFTYITSQFSYFLLPCNHTNLTEVFSCSLVLFSFLLKQQYIFAVDNDARKAVETFCIYKINIVGSNFYAQNVLFPNLQSAIYYCNFFSDEI